LTTRHIDESYQLGTFRDNAASLRRLKKQASIALDLEFEHLFNAGLATGQRVLDAGCGPGIVAAEIGKRVKPSRLLAVDCNEKSLAEASTQFARAGFPGAEVRHANVYDSASFEGETFDFIYSRFLFQHLSSPLAALRNLRKCLAPYGRVCICDIDDAWLAVTPRIAEVDSFLARVGAAQRARGGNRNVGTRLSHYLQSEGFCDVTSTTLLVSTDLVDKSSFCELVFGYKLEVVPDAQLELARAELERIKDAIHSGCGWAAVAVFFVSGTAPGVQ
jgi:2-polyprenyl-3-methyl-5-hydroxy-6-metoxy-1,4-benzoquinol methylase